MSRTGGRGTKRRLHAIHPRAQEPEPLCQQRFSPKPDQVDRPDHLGPWITKDVETIPEGYYKECRSCTEHVENGKIPQQRACYRIDESGLESWKISDRFGVVCPSVARLAAYAWGILDHPSQDVDPFDVAHISGTPWLITEEDLYVTRSGALTKRERGEIERKRQELYRASPTAGEPPQVAAATAEPAVVETDGGSEAAVAPTPDDDPTSLRVGTQAGDDLPAQDVVTGRGLVAGVSGAGKSNSAVVVAEELLELGIPLVVLDPEAEFIGLREDHTVVVFGREDDADVQGGPSEARELARRAVAERLPVVFNLGEYPDEQAEQIAGTVADSVFAAERQYEVPMLFIVDELDEFLPEKGTTAASKPITRVAQRGRKRGLGMLGVSQRPAEISKSFVSQADYHVWHRLTWSNDIDVAENHLPLEFMKLLEDLGDGEVILNANWQDRPRQFFFRMKQIEDRGATPSIADSIGTVPDELPDDLATVSDDRDADACTSCVFCREGIEPPTQLAAETVGADGDVLGAYVVQETTDAAVRVNIREKFLDTELGVEAGDTVSVGIDDGQIRLFLDDSGLIEHTIGDGPRLCLSTRATLLIAAEAGDYVRIFKEGDSYMLERVTDRPDALDYPILGCKQPYTSKTAGEKADYVQLRKGVMLYLGLPGDGEIGVRHDEGRVFLTPPDTADLTYKVNDWNPMIGAKAIKPLAAVGSDTIVARPTEIDDDLPAVELSVIRPGGPGGNR